MCGSGGYSDKSSSWLLSSAGTDCLKCDTPWSRSVLKIDECAVCGGMCVEGVR